MARVSRVGAQPLHDRQAVDVGQPDVEDDARWAALARQLQALLAPGGHHHLPAAVADQVDQLLGEHRIVLDDQQVGLAAGAALAGRRRPRRGWRGGGVPSAGGVVVAGACGRRLPPRRASARRRPLQRQEAGEGAAAPRLTLAAAARRPAAPPARARWSAPGRCRRSGGRCASPTCSNGEKTRSWSSGAMPTPVSDTDSATASVGASARRGSGSSAGGAVDAQRHLAAGGELDGVAEQVGQDLLQPLPVGDDASRAARAPARPTGCRPLSRASGSNMRRACSAISHSGTGSRCSSCLPDSIFDRSSTWLISASRSRPAEWMVRRVLDLLVGQVARLVLGQQVRQDQHAVERRAQLVGHVGQELRLVGAHC